jgi:O-antigen/teichoic acid export membrane protein
MGVVRRQSILSSLFIYLGFAIGAVNILLLFPRYFTPEQIGLTRILLDVAMVFATVCTLGSIPVTLRFHPFYRSWVTEDKNDLPFISLMLGAVGSALLMIALPWLKPFIIRKFGDRSPLFVEYFNLLYPFTVCIVFFTILEAHAWSQRRTVLSNALKEFAFRLLTSALILAFIAGWVDFDRFITLYAWIYLPAILVFVAVLSRNRGLALHLRPSRLTMRMKGRMASFGLFMLGGAVLNIVARTNDTIILASQSTGGLSDAAVFTIATYLVTVMDVPQRSLVSISTPFIAEAWKNRDIPRIDRLYKKTSLNLLVAGIAIFGVVLLNLDDAVRFLGTPYAALTLVVVVSGVAKLVDLATGLNTQILLLSKYWKIEFLTNILLVALSIPLNYWLTKRFNVMGPAYGNLIALCIFNGTRFVLIWKLFRLQPFSLAHLKALAIGGICLLMAGLIPDTGSMVLNITLQTAAFVPVFMLLVVRMRISADINEVMETLWRRISR